MIKSPSRSQVLTQVAIHLAPKQIKVTVFVVLIKIFLVLKRFLDPVAISHICIYGKIYAYMLPYMVYVSIYAYMYAYMLIYANIYIYIYIYVYIY